MGLPLPPWQGDRADSLFGGVNAGMGNNPVGLRDTTPNPRHVVPARQSTTIRL